jgi:uncharacterized protein DUF3568
MKYFFMPLGLLAAGCYLLTLSACQTSQPGSTYTLGTYSATVNGPPDKVTAAASKAAADLKLADIISNSTKVDGNVTAKNANGDTVTVTVAQAGDGVSTVSIRVGATGDEAVSRQLVDGINHHLNDWL